MLACAHVYITYQQSTCSTLVRVVTASGLRTLTAYSDAPIVDSAFQSWGDTTPQRHNLGATEGLEASSSFKNLTKTKIYNNHRYPPSTAAASRKGQAYDTRQDTSKGISASSHARLPQLCCAI